MEKLVEMGFDEHAAAEVLRQTDNNLERSIQVRLGKSWLRSVRV